MKALIAGAGIAGMTAALGFARAGWEAQVFEQAEALAEAGAGIQLSPNACRVLDRLGLLADIRARASAPDCVELRDGLTAQLVYRADLAAVAEARWGAPYLHIHRADLIEIITAAAAEAGVVLNLGRTVTGAVSRGDSVALHLDAGAIAEGDIVVGADGIRSRLRAVIGPVEEPRFSGQAAWRALVPVAALPEGLVPRAATVWVGPGRHLVAYPVRGGALINVVAVVERPEWAEEGWSVPGDPDELRAAFAGWAEPVPTLLGAIGECFFWGLFDRLEQVRWVRDRLALIGDAAHPMLPFLAQGAAMAIEDGAALLRHIGRTPDAVAALAAWEAERWPRVIRVRERSRANGRLFHLSPGVARSVTHSVMGAVGRSTPQLGISQLDWLYGHDATVGA